MKNKRLYLILIGIAGILLVPFLAGAPWDEIDYIAAGILLLGAGLGFELVMRKVSSPGYRAAIIVALLAALFLIYAELAVGILGTPFAGS